MATDIVGKLSVIGMQQSDGLVVAFNPPAIRGLGNTGGFELYVQSRINPDIAQLTRGVERIGANSETGTEIGNREYFFAIIGTTIFH